MDLKEHNRVVTLFEKSRNWTGLEAFNLYKQLTLQDWNKIRSDESWYYTAKSEKLRIIRQYLKQKHGR